MFFDPDEDIAVDVDTVSLIISVWVLVLVVRVLEGMSANVSVRRCVVVGVTLRVSDMLRCSVRRLTVSGTVSLAL